MRATVLQDPAFVKQAGRFVWLDVDTERPESASFLEAIPIEVWPSFLVVVFETGKPVLKWLGTATAEQLGRLLQGGERGVSIEGWILGVMAGKTAGPRRGPGPSAGDGEEQGSRRRTVEATPEGDDQEGFPIRPKDVRYIKLGEGGGWEQECLESQGIVRFGFGSASAERFGLCRDGRWTELGQSFIAEGRTKGTSTRFTRETRLFFEDPGSTLWITFVGERLCWGFLTPAPAERAGYIEHIVASQDVMSGSGIPHDPEGTRRSAGRAFDRAFYMG